MYKRKVESSNLWIVEGSGLSCRNSKLLKLVGQIWFGRDVLKLYGQDMLKVKNVKYLANILEHKWVNTTKWMKKSHMLFFCIIMAITYATVQKALYRQKLVNYRPRFIHWLQVEYSQFGKQNNSCIKAIFM